mmetsp:Transcript_34877/g.51730  ORF Transcript_34877/g.51730 Transcript_34877/m.51730 type:complete len:107 (-) Transcript_34877:287-607(-)
MDNKEETEQRNTRMGHDLRSRPVLLTSREEGTVAPRPKVKISQRGGATSKKANGFKAIAPRCRQVKRRQQRHQQHLSQLSLLPQLADSSHVATDRQQDSLATNVSL